MQNGQVRPQGLAVIEVLKNANSRGLEPEDYDGSRWPARLTKLKQNPSEQDLISFDTALTVSAMRYIRAVHTGRVNPKEFNFQLDNGEGKFSLAEFLQSKVVNGTDPRLKSKSLSRLFLDTKSCWLSCLSMRNTQSKTTTKSYKRLRRRFAEASRMRACLDSADSSWSLEIFPLVRNWIQTQPSMKGRSSRA
jgi:murein L,D-transpeptidase YcbB/YkuD